MTIFFVLLLSLVWCVPLSAKEPWQRFTIDDSLRGADGVKLADFNEDGLLDIATGWEESGRTKVYFHPGVAAVHNAWPSATCGRSPNCEDATWIELNGDGKLDVLASCEGKEQSLRMFFAPETEADSNWTAKTLPLSKGVTRWMFATPLTSELDKPDPLPRSTFIPDIVVGSKNPRGQVSIVRTSNSADYHDWRLEELANASWIMSLVVGRVDGDQDADILYTDRKSPASGVYWLKNPGVADASWERTLIGALGEEVMFVALVQDAQTPDNSIDEFYVGAKPNLVFHFEKKNPDAAEWSQEKIELDLTLGGHMKGLAVADLDQDGEREIVISCENATAPQSGVLLFDRQQGKWRPQNVSGPEGVKFDLLELLDMDQDGDLDILTCEEREGGKGLGVIWYANPG